MEKITLLYSKSLMVKHEKEIDHGNRKRKQKILLKRERNGTFIVSKKFAFSRSNRDVHEK